MVNIFAAVFASILFAQRIAIKAITALDSAVILVASIAILNDSVAILALIIFWDLK